MKASMMAKFTKYWVFLSAGWLMLSCSKHPTDPDRTPSSPESPWLQEIGVTRAPLALADADPDGDVTVRDPYDGEEIIGTDFVEKESILYVSQRTRWFNPFQKKEGTSDPVTPIYRYEYYNSTANWDAGFNFQPCADESAVPGQDNGEKPNPNALNWETVGGNGSVGNGFALYAMYYPDQQEGTRSVATDQSRLEDLQRSDIQGAYHSTSALYSRVRFKLYHLMVYFKINLYVPVYGTTWKDGEEQNASGYSAESLTNAWIMQACPDFTVDWAASISSDTSPSVSLPDDYKDRLTNIPMYSHAHEGDTIIDETQPSDPAGPDTPEGVADGQDADGDGDGDNNGDDDGPGDGETNVVMIRPLKKTRIDISDFLPDEILKIQPMDPDKEDGKMYDTVYKFSFSVVVPAQASEFVQQNPGWLKFAFEQPGSHTPKNYFFQSGFAGPEAPGRPNTIQPTKGTLQVLNLYLPRKGDEVILVGANIKDWTDVETDMNLPQQDPDKGKDDSGKGGSGDSGDPAKDGE